LLNRTGETRTIKVKFRDVRLQAKQRVRDLWRRSDVGTLTDAISCDVESHGTTLLRLMPG
jgi:hypothetical protein